MNNKQQFEQCCLVESLAGLDTHYQPYEILALKRHSSQLAKREKVRLASLDELHKQIRIAQNKNDTLAELKLLRQLNKVE